MKRKMQKTASLRARELYMWLVCGARGPKARSRRRDIDSLLQIVNKRVAADDAEKLLRDIGTAYGWEVA